MWVRQVEAWMLLESSFKFKPFPIGLNQALLLSFCLCHHLTLTKSLHTIRHQPHPLERRWLVVTAKDRPSLVKCPSHSHIVLCPAVPRSLCGLRWRQKRVRGWWESERGWFWFRAACSFCGNVSLWYQYMQPEVKRFTFYVRLTSLCLLCFVLT